MPAITASTACLLLPTLLATPPGLGPAHLPPAAQPVGVCGPGAGPCDQPNGTPGCEDSACCELVCGILPLCCVIGWDASCVATALDKCNALPCSGAKSCQISDLQAHGGGAQNAFFGLSSDLPLGTRSADNFTPAETGSISSVCWWGFYFDFNANADCSESAVDNFTVTYYDDNGNGLPGTMIASFPVTPSRNNFGVIGPVTVYRFDASHPTVGVTAGQCYWIEIRDTLDAVCNWLWATAPPPDGYAVVDDDGSYDVSDGGNWDYAWCGDPR